MVLGSDDSGAPETFSADVCRFCGLELGVAERGVGWHDDCVDADRAARGTGLASHPMYGRKGWPFGLQA